MLPPFSFSLLSLRKTQVGNIDIVQIRPARFIGRDGVVKPYSPLKAIGNALLVVGVSDGSASCVVVLIEV